MFGKRKEITLHRVHDTVVIREGNEKMILRVDGDAMRMVAGLNTAQDMIRKLDGVTEEAPYIETAQFFARVIFGEEQAQKLMDFYRQDAGCVLSVCGKYFNMRLARLITAAQKRK